MQKNNWVTWMPFVMALCYFAALVVVFRNALFVKQDMRAIEQQYLQSNYVRGEAGKKISDDVVYTYAGYSYAHGTLPTSVNFEHPPLAKYVYGVSHLLAGNAAWGVALFFGLFLGLFTINAHWLLNCAVLRVAALVLLGTNLLYATHFTKAMLDIPLAALMMSVITMYLLYQRKPSNKRALFFGLVCGLYFSTKYFIPLSALLVLFLLYSMARLHRNRNHLVLSLLATIAAYAATYVAMYMNGWSLFDALRFEWWRLHWFLGKTDAPKGLIFQTLMFGRHRAWWEAGTNLATYAAYNLTWPISFVLFLFFLASTPLRSVKHYLPIVVWTVLSLAALSLGASNDFYLIPLFPWFILFGLLSFDTVKKEG